MISIIIKRLFDLIFSFLIILILIIPILIISIYLKIDSSGPIFFFIKKGWKKGKNFLNAKI